MPSIVENLIFVLSLNYSQAFKKHFGSKTWDKKVKLALDRIFEEGVKTIKVSQEGNATQFRNNLKFTPSPVVFIFSK
jgi:hypothetical protein